MTLPKKGLKKYDYNIDMEKKDLKKLTKDQLIKLLLNKEKKKPKVVIVDDTKPTRPKQQKKVSNHEDLLDNDPFKDEVTQHIKPTPPPRTEKWVNVKPKPVPRKSVNEDIILPSPKPTRKPPPPPILQLEDKERITDVSSPKITQLQKALKNSTKSFAVDIVDNKDPLHQLTETRNVIEQYLNRELIRLRGFKFIETLKITFEKQLGNKTTFEKQLGNKTTFEKQLGNKTTFEKQLRNKTTIKTAYFNSKTKTLINENEINEVLQTSRQELMKAIGQWISEGSGWTIKSVDGHYINLTKYKPLKGSSYIELPTELRNSSKGLINLQNTDSECFRWCHIRHLNPQEKYPQRIKKSDKEYINKLDYSGINFPVTIKQINKIEKNNNIRINVFGYEEKQSYPIYVSKEKFDDHLELLLITKDENKHFVLIKDFNKFMYQQTKHKERKHFCMYCLQCFSSERILANHVNNCLTVNGVQAINMPKQGENILKFNNFHKQLPVPFVIYADFEAITKKIQGCKQSEEMDNEKNKRSYTEAYQTHEDCGSAYKLVCCYDDKYSKDICVYRGENAVYRFMEKMLEEVKYCKAVIKKHFNKPLVMTEDDEMCFKLMDKCHICGEKYTDKDVRVRDHCHITGKFRASAHQEGNLKLRIKPENIKIPIIFHNLRGYDSDFIMQQIGEIAKKHAYTNKKGEKQDLNINAIPNNMEKYMAFMLGNHLNFIDSFQFMSSSLDKLVSNLPKNDLIYTSQVFKGKRLNLMSQKVCTHTTSWIASKSSIKWSYLLRISSIAS